MTDWSLTQLFRSLHGKIAEDLRVSREALKHPGTKGGATEAVWLSILASHLPRRYEVCSGHVVDREGQFSDQIDLIIFDRQYSPFIFDFHGAKVVPAESVYAVVEAKQAVNTEHVKYAQDKVLSVRRLHRTSLPIPTATGMADPTVPKHIIGGLVTFDSDWNPPLGDSLMATLAARPDDADRLDIGCISSHGIFVFDEEGAQHVAIPSASATTRFLLELIRQLQAKATVPMIDINAYARWITD